MPSRDNETADARPNRPQLLREAIRQARIESAERTAVVVDLRDAEVARLELLNEALDPLFSEIPAEIELFDRGISRGDPPRLWIDAVAHVVMGRDKRVYRFVQDTRFGRRILAESSDVDDLAKAVTRYVARRIVERERALAGEQDVDPPQTMRKASHGRVVRAFVLGLFSGITAVVAALYLLLSAQQGN